MSDRFSHAMEDYLKVIYDLTIQSGLATTSDLAARLNVTPASVTGMVKKLASADPPLLEYHKHRGVKLTAAGERVALKVIRNHRLLELFLQRTLGYSWDEVHAEADRLEHVISEDFEERIAQALGDPLHDPHGEPIPTRDLHLPPISETRLSELRPGQEAVIERVDALDVGLLRYLGLIGLVPLSVVEVIGYSAFDGNLHLRVRPQEEVIVLGPQVTRHVYVDVLAK